MKDSLYKNCELFIKNRDKIKLEFPWESNYLYPLCAGIYTSRNLEADVKKMKFCKTLLKQKTSVFSNFRGTSKMATITLLALNENPEEKMEQMLTLYEAFKKVFWTSEYLTVASATIVNFAKEEQFNEIVKKTRIIYDKMKAEHPFLTSGEDSVFAALLALSDLDDIQKEIEIERCYQFLKDNFFSKNSVQSLSQVLALSEKETRYKCMRVIQLFEYLKEQGHKYGTSYELATLGVLALLDIEIAALAKDMIEADNYLKEQKGFGVFGIGSKQRLMYAGMITMCDYITGMQYMQTANIHSVISLLIAQQTAICASTIAVASAASAANSSS